MIATPRLGAAVLALLALAACEEGQPNREPLVVNASSGAKVDLSRTSWEACRDDLPEAGQSRHWREVHGEEGAVTFVVTDYDAPGCTGTADGPFTFVALAFAAGDAEVSWTGNAPPDGLSPSPVATRVFLSLGQFWSGDVYYLDDRGETRVLYTGDPRRDVPLVEGFPTVLHPVGEEEQP